MVAIFAVLALAGQPQIPSHYQNSMGVPWYPNGQPVHGSYEPRAYGGALEWLSETSDHTPPIKDFYKNYLRDVHVVYDALEHYMPDHEAARRMALVGTGKHGRTVRIRCEPVSRNRTSIQVIVEAVETPKPSRKNYKILIRS
jgi:hypothetical protein